MSALNIIRLQLYSTPLETHVFSVLLIRLPFYLKQTEMAKLSPNKRKSQSHEVQTPKKQRGEGDPKTPLANKNKTPKGGKTPKSAKKNTQEDKLNKFSGTANLEEEVATSGDESDYEVDQEVKPEKITKTTNEDSEEADDDSEDDSEDIENAVNENSENGKKKQNNKTKNGTKIDVKDVDELVGKDSAKKQRYVLFIGNLPYDVSIEEIKTHFKNGIKIVSVRIPQGKGPDKKPRGFGYLEVDSKESYLKAMSMHHSFLKGRRINVLYTTGGKKNSGKTKDIIKSKNFKLNALRKDGKLEGSKKDSQKRSVRRAKKRSFDAKTE